MKKEYVIDPKISYDGAVEKIRKFLPGAFMVVGIDHNEDWTHNKWIVYHNFHTNKDLKLALEDLGECKFLQDMKTGELIS